MAGPIVNAEVEAALLGAVLVHRDAVELVTDLIRPADYGVPAHSLIAAAVEHAHVAGIRPDRWTVGERLRVTGQLDQVGGWAALDQLAAAAVHPEGVEGCARIVRDLSSRRQLVSAAAEITSAAHDDAAEVDELLDRGEASILGIRDSRPGGIAEHGWEDALELGVQRARGVVPLDAGVATGWPDLDEKLGGGLHPGELAVVAARPGVGKSALAAGIADHVAVKLGLPVLVHSLEMSREELALRMLAAGARADFGRLRGSSSTPDEVRRIERAADALMEAPLSVDDRRHLTVGDIRAEARRARRRHRSDQYPDGRLGLIVVDYLQLLRPSVKGETRQVEVAEMSRALKCLAGDLNVPVLVLAQLNRLPDGRADKRPMLSDLRESGAIEQDADAVLMLYRDEMYNPTSADQGVAEVIIAKQRNGPMGTVKLAYIGESTLFASMARHS